ncbi:MAG: DNA polymerase III subunit [Thermomicrobiales bacterium]|nr:DNA polymerase III subunit [Thermomicrobiales bacterium]MCO5223867.1 DNA polymerase III subunit [Thermomicrobiales bacterium]MCO5227431.1 DNA polymerase III subunit [Thermomicrobiales bacterium]
MSDSGAGDGTWPIWGHSHAVRELKAAVTRGPHHAYIVSGYQQLGKRTLAIAFAQALLCTDPPNPGVACGACRSCLRITRGSHPDVSEWNLALQQQVAEKSSTSRNLTLNISTVRAISAGLALQPLESRYRIVIVDDVETMQETAQEAFLKTLEEPPPYAVIILLTSDSELLLETIRSRSTVIQLQPVPTAIIAEGLRSEGVELEQASVVADASEGRPGWAVRAAADATILAERRELYTETQRWIEADRYNQLIEATRLGEAFGKDRNAVYARLAALQHQWRNELLTSLESRSDDRSTAALLALKSIDTCFSDLDANVRPKLALQTMVLQWQSSQQ